MEPNRRASPSKWVGCQRIANLIGNSEGNGRLLPSRFVTEVPRTPCIPTTDRRNLALGSDLVYSLVDPLIRMTNDPKLSRRSFAFIRNERRRVVSLGTVLEPIISSYRERYLILVSAKTPLETTSSRRRVIPGYGRRETTTIRSRSISISRSRSRSSGAKPFHASELLEGGPLAERKKDIFWRAK